MTEPRGKRRREAREKFIASVTKHIGVASNAAEVINAAHDWVDAAADDALDIAIEAISKHSAERRS